MWGHDDCALSIANIDREVLGIDPAQHLRGHYHDQDGALRIMGVRGVYGVAVDAARRMGWRPIDRGRIVNALDGDRAVALGPAGVSCVIRLERFWVGRFQRGEVVLMDRNILRAWSVI